MADLEELRLFPLNLVLFPGMSLPLRIFEERYKLMIGECLEGNLAFGVVLIKEGPEVGGPAAPHRVGTTARIVKSEPGRQGGYRIETVGERRFRISDVTGGNPYLTGNVEFLDEEVAEDLAELPGKVAKVLGEYWKALASLKGGWIQSVETPEDPLALSYAASEAVAYPPMVGQYLLQLSSGKERLERVLPLLEERLTLVKEAVEKRTPYRGPRLN